MDNDGELSVLCIGMMVADIIAHPISTFDLSVDTTVVDNIQVQCGGDALNAAIGLARLGVRTALAGKVGNDAFGRFLVETVRGAGVDGSSLKIAEGESTGSVLVLVKGTGERAFVYHGGTNDTLCEADVNAAALGEADIVHFGGVCLMPGLDGDGEVSILSRARERGKTTSMDVTWDPTGRWLDIVRPCLPHLDYFLPSLNEAKHIAGTDDPEQIAERLLEHGVGTVVVKLGSHGCYVRSADEGFRLPACPVAQVVDTTGAGDAFLAGFLTGLSKRLPVRECAELANAVGAMAVRAVGSTAGVTSFSDALDLMAAARAARAARATRAARAARTAGDER